MELDVSPHLQGTRDLLMRSLGKRPDEQAPELPEGLLDDLTRRHAVAARPASAGWFERALRLVGSPGFGLAATAALVAAILLPQLADPKPDESYRGLSAPVFESDAIQLVLIGEPIAIREFLDDSSDFEATLISSVSDLETARSIDGPCVILDFGTATLAAVDSFDRVLHRAELPEETGDLSLAVAAAMARLE